MITTLFAGGSDDVELVSRSLVNDVELEVELADEAMENVDASNGRNGELDNILSCWLNMMKSMESSRWWD